MKRLEIQDIFMIMFTRSSERIFNPTRFTGLLLINERFVTYPFLLLPSYEGRVPGTLHRLHRVQHRVPVQRKRPPTQDRSVPIFLLTDLNC